MKDKKIVVALKYFQGELNPFDAAALECALSSGAKEVVAITMAPQNAFEAFRSLTRLGVKGVFISDPVYAGSDTVATSLVLAKAIERLSPDLVFCGRQSVDGDTAQVPAMLAERLGFDIFTRIMQIDGNAVTVRSGESYEISSKAVLTFERIKTLRFPSIFSSLKDVEVWDNTFLQIDESRCGLSGSPTRVVRSYESSVGMRSCKFVGVSELDSIINSSLSIKKEEQSKHTGEKLDLVYYVGNIEKVAKSVANEVYVLPVLGKSVQEIASYVLENGIKTVLFEDDEDLKTLASRLAVRVGAGVCADCISFSVSGGRLVMTRPARGGNVTADIVCNSEVAFATVRTARRSEDVIFSVGKGSVELIDKIRDKAKEYGGALCCSRIVADSGKMPYSAQVGLTGKCVSPKVYIAVGISGAVQHTCAISSAGVVIPINPDKSARIFDYADYGIVAKAEEVFN